MKIALMLGLFLTLQVAHAQTLRAKRIKQEMLDRVEVLVTKVTETRDALDKEDAKTACLKINELFEIYPKHLTAIGTHMDLFNGKTVKIKNEALTQLIYMHQQSLICAKGVDHEYIDIDKIDKEMKKILKSLKKQKKIIKKADTDYENSFYYEYEF